MNKPFVPALREVRDRLLCVVCMVPRELFAFHGPPWDVCRDHYTEVRATLLEEDGAKILETVLKKAVYDDPMAYDDELAEHQDLA